MKANLRLERINGDINKRLGIFAIGQCAVIKTYLGIDLLEGMRGVRDFVAEITDFDIRYRYKRTFLRGKVDYAQSNLRGTRGVFVNYTLESGKIYHVSDPRSWRRTDKYYVTVTNEGEIVKITEEEVSACLKRRLESASTTLQNNE